MLNDLRQKHGIGKSTNVAKPVIHKLNRSCADPLQRTC